MIHQIYNIAPLLLAAAGAAASTGGQMLGNYFAGKGSFNKQSKLMDKSQQMQEELMKQNQKIQLDTWNKTGYKAQVEQMNEAGLNPALMYGMGGGGGQTTGGGAPSAPGGQAQSQQAPNFDILGAMAMKAQIDNTNADTELKKAELPNKPKEGLILDQKFDNLRKEYDNLTQDEILKKYNNIIASNNADISTKTLDDIVKTTNMNMQAATSAAKSAAIKANIDEQSQQDVINTIHDNAILTNVKAANEKLNGQLTEQQITNMKEELKVISKINNFKERELKVKELLSKFDTNTASHVKQWTGIFTDIIDGIITARTGIPSQKAPQTTIHNYGDTHKY